MQDPFSWGALGAAAVTQGITFLFAQAGELLKWRRERAAAEPVERPVTLELPAALGGGTAQAVADLAQVDKHLEALQGLRASLLEYAEGKQVEPGDDETRANVDALRAVLEEALGTHLTFVGEDRPASGAPLVTGRVTARTVRQAKATGVDADEATEGTVRGEVSVEHALEGAELTGVRIRRIGRRGPSGPSAT